MKDIVILFLPFLPLCIYLVIKYPAYIYVLFFCAASFEGGFVSEVRTLTLTRVCFLLLVPSFIIYVITRARWKKYDLTVLIIIGGFFVYYLISYFWAPNQVSASSKVLRICIYLMVCVIGYYLFKNAPISQYRHFIALYIISVIILMGYLYLQMGEFVRIGELSERTSERISPYDPNSFGRSIVVALTMAISLCFCARRKIVWLVFSVLLVGASLPLLMIAGSRSSILVLFFMCLLLGSTHVWSREKWSFLRVIGVFGVCLLCGAVVFSFSKELLPANLSYRLTTLVYQPVSSIKGNIRVDFLEQGLVLVESAPFFGLGMRAYESVMQYPHNVLMEVLIESGFIGLAFLLLGIAVLIVRCIGLLRYSRNYLLEWHTVVFVMVFSVASSWMFAFLIGELSDHRVSYFMLSVLLGLDHRIRTTAFG